MVVVRASYHEGWKLVCPACGSAEYGVVENVRRIRGGPRPDERAPQSTFGAALPMWMASQMVGRFGPVNVTRCCTCAGMNR